MSNTQNEYRKLVKQYGFKKAGEIWRKQKEKVKETPRELAPKNLPPKINEKLEPLKDTILRGPEFTNIQTFQRGTGKDTIMLRGRAMVELIQHDAWVKWLKPQIEADISNGIRKMYNGTDQLIVAVAKGEISEGRRLLQLINKWLYEYKTVMSEE